MMDLDPVEVRMLGCLIEKQRTTPDQYPLSLNALRLACNQTTNRDPVVAVRRDDDPRGAAPPLPAPLQPARERAHEPRVQVPPPARRGARARHGQLAVLAVLMLRGAQTPGELKQRTDRMQGFADLAARARRARPADRARAASLRIERRPGQKEERYLHRLSEEAADGPPPEQAAAAAPAPPQLRPRPRPRRPTTSGSTGSRPRSRSCARSSRGCARRSATDRES